MQSFLEKHADIINGQLTCFDRMIFKGYLPLTFPNAMAALFARNQWLTKDFKKIAPKLATEIADHAKETAEYYNREFRLVNKNVKKENEARTIAEKEGIENGLVCVFQTMEGCSSYGISFNEKKPIFVKKIRKCRFFYFYYMDREFGLMHVRIQSWFPFPIQIYINGHEWLACKMKRHGIDFVKNDNTFSYVSDYKRAQRFSDNLCSKNWLTVLEKMARKVNPLLKTILKGCTHYWVCDQCEIATDIVFKDRASLKNLYDQLLRHATLTLGTEDVLSFFGKKLHGNFDSEVLTDYKKRSSGARIKHRLQGNWIKLYDKYGLVLRCETVINKPRMFFAHRKGKRHGKEVMGWFPMNKGVSNMRFYFKNGEQACSRYFEALTHIENPHQAVTELSSLTKPVTRNKKRARALNPLSDQDGRLFHIICRGEYLLHGFRNKDIATLLFPKTCQTKQDRKKRSRRVTYLFGILRRHGLIAKIPRSRRYKVSAKGRRLMSCSIWLKDERLPLQMTG